LVILIFWRGSAVLFAPLAVMWLWNVWDAYRLTGGRALGLGVPFLLGTFIVYALGLVATEIRPGRLVSGWVSVRPYVRALTRPELLAFSGALYRSPA
jgi:hypothetical protein